MDISVLILYSRVGCCLCEGLEERLQTIPLDSLLPPLELLVIDIDAAEVPDRERSLFDQKVPVMFLASRDLKKRIELPRVSPRLDNERLLVWLQQNTMKTLGITK